MMPNSRRKTIQYEPPAATSNFNKSIYSSVLAGGGSQDHCKWLPKIKYHPQIEVLLKKGPQEGKTIFNT